MSETNNDTPDIPAHIANRGAIGLTTLAAEQTRGKSDTLLLGDEGYTPRSGLPPKKGKTPAEKATELKAIKYAGGTPCRGLTPDQIDAITNRDYEDAPKMDFRGDRDPKFVDWIWAKHPWDAKVRYSIRQLWPSKLPANWPPPTPEDWLPTTAATSPSGAPKLYTPEEAALIVAGHRPRTYSQAEVDQMIADAKAGLSTPVDRVPAKLKTSAELAEERLAQKTQLEGGQEAPAAPRRASRKAATLPTPISAPPAPPKPATGKRTAKAAVPSKPTSATNQQ